MGGIEVRSPEGRLFNVTRRWTSWRRRDVRYRQRMDLATHHRDGSPKIRMQEPGDSPTSPGLLAVLELPVEAAVALGNMVARVVLRRPWRIDVLSDRGRLLVVHRCGWDDSLRLCRDLAAQLRHGTPLEDLVVPPERGPWTPVHPEPTDVLRRDQGPIS